MATMTRRGGISKKGERYGWEYLGPKPKTPSHVKYFLNISFFKLSSHFVFSFHSRSPSRLIPGMIASDSRSRNVEMDHFIPFPFPNFWNALVHSLPVLEIWEWIFYSLPVPEIWKWSFSLPFRFPKFGNGILNSCSCSELKKVIPAHPWQKYTITQLRIYMTTDWNYVLIICVFK